MDNENHKNTWNNFYKVCSMGFCRCSLSFSFNGNFLIVAFNYENWFNFLENQNIEKSDNYSRNCEKIYFSWI